nr:putative transporter c83.11 [Quercus suber]
MVPHATTDERRRSSTSTRPSTKSFKFPDFSHEQLQFQAVEDDSEDISRGPSPQPLLNGLPAGLHSSERWPGRRNPPKATWTSWANGAMNGGSKRQAKQKSLTEAIKTVRTRKMSISESGHEIAESLKAPVSMKLVVCHAEWTSARDDVGLTVTRFCVESAFPRPITLTVVQFFLVSSWCFILSSAAKRNTSLREAVPVLKNGIRKPSKEIIMATLPLTAFQIGGHILNSDAMSRIPVSLVHTIKGLSPLMTVFAYRVFFDIRYSVPVYLSLVPLTLGVIMACSASFKGNLIGLTYASGSAILFVTQNIVSKTIFNEAAKAEADGTPVGRRKPDKLNLLCYSSLMAFLITCPIWLWFEGFSIAADWVGNGAINLTETPGSLGHRDLALELLFNGTFHFGQSLVAFVLLGMVSPVTYSVASLIKRVVVIMFAIIWFGNRMTPIQGFGFGLTFVGLYLYDRTSDAAKADKLAREMAISQMPLLPLGAGDAPRSKTSVIEHSSASMEGPYGASHEFDNGNDVKSNRSRSNGHTVQSNGAPMSLPPGTKAAETWQQGDAARDLRSGGRRPYAKAESICTSAPAKPNRGVISTSTGTLHISAVSSCSTCMICAAPAMLSSSVMSGGAHGTSQPAINPPQYKT